VPIPVGKTSAEKAEIKQWLKDRDKYPTGFCNENGKPGQHEGTKPKDWRGKPMPTCPMSESCPCECHLRVDKMFQMTGLDRKHIPNPEYIPEKAEFVLPDVTEDPIGDAAVPSGGVITPPDIERPVATPPTPAAAPLATRRTETGRAARGGLEAQVWDACRSLEEQIGNEDPITPKQVGDWIATKYVIPTPSSGAINAVWDRWSKLGFCKQAKKPNRFLEFCGEGTWEELARMKGSAKRQLKSAQTAARLGRR
jgi:hypothetical protein